MKRCLLYLVVLMALAGASIVAAPPEAPSSSTAPRPIPPADETAAPSATGAANAPVIESPNKIKVRQREGAKLTDRRGRFERRGDRYVFLGEAGAAHYVVVENLMLERVANMLDDAAGGELLWNISGQITEFRGSNFLILQRAVVKASAGPQEPRRLDDPLAEAPLGSKNAR